MINHHCPRETVAKQLELAATMLRDKCGVLHYGLALDALQTAAAIAGDAERTDAPAGGAGPVNILWNARLEDDKDPATFILMLQMLKAKHVPFGLIVRILSPT